MLNKINNFIKNPAIRLILGVASVIIGFVLMILPLVPGWWLLIIGLELLGLRLLVQKKAKCYLGACPIFRKLSNVKARVLK